MAVREAGWVILRVGDGVVDLELVLSGYTVPIQGSAVAQRTPEHGGEGRYAQGVAVGMTVGHLGDIGGIG